MRNPHEIYREVYFMVKTLGFSAEYVENISPSERGVYIMYYHQDNKQKQIEDNSKELADLGLTEDDLR